MSLLVEELRRLADGYHCTYSEAADEIERLQAELYKRNKEVLDAWAERDALRELLLDVLDYMYGDDSYNATLLRRNIDAAIDAARNKT